LRTWLGLLTLLLTFGCRLLGLLLLLGSCALRWLLDRLLLLGSCALWWLLDLVGLRLQWLLG